MNKRIDMSAFVGRDFDMIGRCIHGFDADDVLISLSRDNLDDDQIVISPRVNKPQVLDDYSWLPAGLAVEAEMMTKSGSLISGPYYSQLIRYFDLNEDFNGWRINHISVIGVHPDYELHGKEMGMQVIEL